MVKLGKKKLAELSELSKKQKIAGSADSDESTAKNGDGDKKNEVVNNKDTVSASSSADDTKNETVSKKRKATAQSSKANEKDGSETDESDDLPLNGSGSKSSNSNSANGPPRKKLKKTPPKAKSGATLTATAKSENNNKKAAAKTKDTQEDEEDDIVENEDDNEETEFEVEAIVGHKSKRGESFFLVRWKGYGKDEDSWEPEAELNCDDLIEEYRKGNPKKNTNDKKTTTKGVGRGRKSAASKQLSKQETDPEKEWAVERIVDFIEDDEHGGLYRIRWKGFGAKDDTWEPESNLSCEGLIEKFKKSLEQQGNVDMKHLRESPKKTKRLVNETIPRSNLHNRIERSSKRSAAKNRVFYGEE
ncbi:heterochromatin protein 1 [Drosophila sulfurigaster albostrigata]|uniref:heterochromatin protein 1 n=1 Tax=Drosophila sulfurigaster albostrigata TaxID=89887 RepID=UPI002D21B5CC|nr:heterochromatin protein 1 [Drosophila sulfurigaster albostrigata]